MEVKDIKELLSLGFSKDDIVAMVKSGNMGSDANVNTETPTDETPADNAEAPNTSDATNTPEQDDPYKELKDEIAKLRTTVQNVNLANATQPNQAPQQSAEEVLADIYSKHF